MYSPLSGALSGLLRIFYVNRGTVLCSVPMARKDLVVVLLAVLVLALVVVLILVLVVVLVLVLVVVLILAVLAVLRIVCVVVLIVVHFFPHILPPFAALLPETAFCLQFRDTRSARFRETLCRVGSVFSVTAVV